MAVHPVLTIPFSPARTIPTSPCAWMASPIISLYRSSKMCRGKVFWGTAPHSAERAAEAAVPCVLLWLLYLSQVDADQWQGGAYHGRIRRNRRRLCRGVSQTRRASGADGAVGREAPTGGRRGRARDPR